MGKSKELAELGQVVSQNGGNVGIGADSPTEALHIAKAFPAVKLDNIDAGGHSWRIASGSTNSGFAGKLQIYNEDTSTIAAYIDASGRVTMPYQPFGRATGSSSATNTFVSGTALNFFSVSVAQGGITMSGNSRWTVPVSGVYLITACIYFYPQVASHYGYAITRNGALTSGSNQWEWNGSPYSGRMDNSLNVSYITEASASDYFELQMLQSNDIYTGPTNNSFCIYLLG